ncbi:MAG TPA: TIGR00730 family Rossman fold protein [Acidimicrobiales bacterium]|nr:TIGR00730 family Rossman fold protein [Acidimicrobiales bacterium]
MYCASSPGGDPAFVVAATEFGRLLATGGRRLVYGGGHVGLMGAIADAVLAEGGEVVGVITRALEAKEIAHTGLTSLRVVDTMHERKAAMADEADAFVMLPGGFGTFEEFLEVVTWTQLGVHSKPCGVLNVGGFFDPLLTLMETASNARFLRPEHRDMVVFESDPDALLAKLDGWVPVVVDKWIDRTER